MVYFARVTRSWKRYREGEELGMSLGVLPLAGGTKSYYVLSCAPSWVLKMGPDCSRNRPLVTQKILTVDPSYRLNVCAFQHSYGENHPHPRGWCSEGTPGGGNSVMSVEPHKLDTVLIKGTQRAPPPPSIMWRHREKNAF